MKIKLLNNGTGVIISRQPRVTSGDEEFVFEGALSGSTAIFESNGNSYYRELNKGSCVLPFKALDGEVPITVFVKENSKAIWRCEGIKAIKLQDGSVLLMPSDGDIPGEMAKIRIENHDLREKNVELEARIDKLDKAFEKLFEGYDII